mgnify:CR=1 FL=1
MANTSRIFGFRPVRYLNGAAYNGQAQTYGFSASDTNACFKGDVVAFDSTNRSTALTDAFVPGVQLISAKVAAFTTGAFRGIAVGFYAQPEFSQNSQASLGLLYRVASTARYALVIDDPMVVFEVEESGNSYTSASSNGLNKTTDIGYSAGNTTTGISGVVIAGAGFQTAAGRPFRALRYTQRVDNFNFTASDANSRAHFDVIMANSDLVQAVGTNFGA